MKLFSPIVVLTLAVAASRSAAAGVTAVSLSPASPVVPGTTVTVTVTGTNPCPQVEIDFGDGQIVKYATMGGLPFAQSHAYPAAGSFTIVVKGHGNCRGTASAPLVVAARRPGDGRPAGGGPGRLAGSADALCAVVDCAGLSGAMTGPPPKITKVLGVIQPGGPVLVGGENFGNTPGRVRMIAEGGSQEFLLQNLEWYPSGIGGKIPNVPGVGEAKNPRFLVETSAGRVSNEWGVNWIVALKVLPRDDVKVVSCGKDGKTNFCNGQFFQIGLPCGQGLITDAAPTPAGVTFSGRHDNCWGAVGDDEGTDVFEISLRNGWVLHELSFEKSISGKDEGTVTAPSGFVPGATSWKPEIKWSVSPADEIAYWAFVVIRGPKGVPHK